MLTPAGVVLILVALIFLLALGAWVAGPDDAHRDARRRNRAGDEW